MLATKIMATDPSPVLSRIDAMGGYHSPNICFATEGPLIHDGAQATAVLDMSNTGALVGPNSSGQFLAVKLILNAARKVGPASSGDRIYGILQNKPSSGQVADVGIIGISKAVAGAAVSAGDVLMVDASGRLIRHVANGTNFRVGQSMDGAATAGQIMTVALLGGGVSTAAT